MNKSFVSWKKITRCAYRKRIDKKIDESFVNTVAHVVHIRQSIIYRQKVTSTITFTFLIIENYLQSIMNKNSSPRFLFKNIENRN